MKKWLLVYCKTRQEQRVERNLCNQGFDVFSPVITVSPRQGNKRVHSRQELLFPSYLFINVDPREQSISPVRSTRGVLCFVKFGNVYASVSEEMIQKIKTRIAEQADRKIAATEFREGDRVSVNCNGFDNVEAIFSRPCGEDRVMILMNIMGREAPVAVRKDSISRLD